jgi:hypothetical protein
VTSEAFQRCLPVLAWMIGPIVAGYLLWHGALKRLGEGEKVALRTARALSYLSMLGTITPFIVIVFWVAALPAGRALTLPLVGSFAHLLGGGLGWLFGRAAGYSAPARASVFLATTCSNILTLGSITALFLLSTPEDPGATRAVQAITLYRLLEAPYYFLVAWPLAALIALPSGPDRPGWGEVFRRTFRPVTLSPVAAIVVGIALNLLGPAPPPILERAASVLIRVNVTFLGLMVGLSLRAARPLKNLKSCGVVAAIKFLVVPGAAVGMAWLLGHDGPTLQVVAICGSMPVAFMALVGANFTGLEEELVSSLWLFTTGAMVVVVPVLAMLMPILA